MVKVLQSTTVNVRQLGNIVRSGAVVIYPTDTVYGLGCNPFNENAIIRIVEMKRRGAVPMPLLSSSLREVRRRAILTPQAERLAEHFWPGALTLILKSRARFSRHLLSRIGEVGLRIPASTFARELTSEVGGLIVGTSANISGMPAASTLREALSQLSKTVDFAVDGGKLPGTPSTVVKLSDGKVQVVREGAVPLPEILKVAGRDR